MVDFICIGFLELQGTQSKLELQNKKSLSTVGFEPGTFHLRSRRAINCDTRSSDVHIGLKFTCVICLHHVVYIGKYFVLYCSLLTFVSF